MYHDVDEYPYDYEDLPDVAALIDEVEWDVLCVYDACRWDAFTEVCGDAEPVCSPGSNTPKWTSRVWCNDDYDWSDVTYITGNPHTTATRRGPENGDSWSGKIEDHVGEYVRGYEDDEVWGATDSGPQPEALAELALDYEPPIVLHQLPPHEPFIGDLSMSINLGPKDVRNEYVTRIDERFKDFPDVTFGSDTLQFPSAYYGVITGLVDPSMVRLAYIKNLERAWTATRKVRRNFDTVISTADHGERLGAPLKQEKESEFEIFDDNVEPPPRWAHDGNSSQGRVIPFHVNNNELELPDPQSVGAVESHDWTLDRNA